MKPNIFNYATSELTNDAMICWMVDWANSCLLYTSDAADEL